jgi:O-antigen/teichoic acid export membrane protein
MPLIFIVGIAQILAIQALIPLKKDKIILRASFLGAAISIISNIIFVEKYGATGSAIVLSLCETTVTFYYIIICTKYKIISLPWKNIIKHGAVSLPYIIICLISIVVFKNNDIVMLFFSIALSIIYFFISNKYILENETIYGIIKNLTKKT